MMMSTRNWALALAAAGMTIAASPASAVTEMTVATFHPRTGTADVESLFKFKELVEQRTAGEMKVNVFFGGTLGGERELVEQLKLSTVHLCMGGWAMKGAYLSRIMPWGVPYLFTSQEQIIASVNGRLGEEIKKTLLKEGIVWGGLYFRGNRQVTSNRKIETPQDLKGLKIRLPEDPNALVVWKAFGALPVPIPSPEIFSSLQTGVVEAQENPISSNYNRKLWEVQKYTVLTNHIVDIQDFLLSKAYLDKLPKAQQDIVMGAVKESLDWATKFSMDQESKYIEEMKAKGMQFITVKPKPFQDVALTTLSYFKEKWEPWVLDEVTRIVGK